MKTFLKVSAVAVLVAAGVCGALISTSVVTGCATSQPAPDGSGGGVQGASVVVIEAYIAAVEGAVELRRNGVLDDQAALDFEKARVFTAIAVTLALNGPVIDLNGGILTAEDVQVLRTLKADAEQRWAALLPPAE